MYHYVCIQFENVWMDLEEAEKRQAAQDWEPDIKHVSIIPSLKIAQSVPILPNKYG